MKPSKEQIGLAGMKLSQDSGSTPTLNVCRFPSESRLNKKILSEEAWFSFLREWQSWKLQWEPFFSNQLLLSVNFESRSGSRQKCSLKNSVVGGGGQI